jgi:hypothetical protein
MTDAEDIARRIDRSHTRQNVVRAMTETVRRTWPMTEPIPQCFMVLLVFPDAVTMTIGSDDRHTDFPALLKSLDQWREGIAARL